MKTNSPSKHFLVLRLAGSKSGMLKFQLVSLISEKNGCQNVLFIGGRKLVVIIGDLVGIPKIWK